MDNPYERIEKYVSSLPKELTVGHRTSSQVFSDDVITSEIYRGAPTYIVSIADQINKSFHFEIYDGCLVLMRRLIETLLVLAFKERKIEPEIKDKDGNHFKLSKIIGKAINNPTLSLTYSTKQSLKHFATGGNLSAHNIYFRARKKDLNPEFRLRFRASIEELLHKAGILK